MGKLKWVWGAGLWLSMVAFIVWLPLLPLVSNQPLESPFIKSLRHDKAIVFFGFGHCDQICPLTLATLASVFDSPGSQSLNTQVVFVDIDANSNAQAANDFAQQFHRSFIGYHPSADELKRLTVEFGLNTGQSGEQISHQGRTYLLTRDKQDWRLAVTYNANGFTADSLKKALN